MVHQAIWRDHKQSVLIFLRKAYTQRSDPPHDHYQNCSEQISQNGRLECRLHDLRHRALTNLAEAGTPEGTMLALAGHMSRAMIERYSYIRMGSKRDATESLSAKPIPEIVPANSPAKEELAKLN